MHYFVDGYNLLFRSSQTHDVLQKQRELVIAELLDKVTVLELNMTLVFDSAHTASLSTKQHLGPLEIVYTNAGETADAYILSELQICEAPQRETVITSDKLLAEHARRLGAKTMNVESFLTWLQARYHRRRGKYPKKTVAILTTLPALPPSRPQQIPTPQALPPASLPIPSGAESYLQIFEMRLKDLVDSTPIKPAKLDRAKSRRPVRKPQATKAAPESDNERWLRLFQARADTDKEAEEKE